MASRFRARLAVTALLLGAACGGGSAPAGPAAPTGSGPFFPSGSERLSYALDLPAGTGPFPAFVLGHGSGRSTKNEGVFLARQLTALGFAVLRYDKRGVGDSTGVYEGVSIGNSVRMIGALAQDMAAGVAFLETRPEIDARRIGLTGASQAGWIIPAAAVRAPRVRFMVLLVGPTVSVGEENYYSDLAEGTTTSFEDLSAQLRLYTGPRGFDPRPDLDRLDVPGLWLLGARDRSIPTRETVGVLQELRAQGRPFEWVVFEESGHSLGGADYMPAVSAFLARHAR